MSFLQSRDTADRMLNKDEVGAFLVRYSDRTQQLVASCLDGEIGRTRHVLMHVSERGVSWTTARNVIYPSVDALLDGYPRTYAIGLERSAWYEDLSEDEDVSGSARSNGRDVDDTSSIASFDDDDNELLYSDS